MNSQLSKTLETLFRRGRELRRRASDISRRARTDAGTRNLDVLDRLCHRLLSGHGEASGVKLAQEIIQRYAALDPADRECFFLTLARDHGPDWQRVEAEWAENAGKRDRTSFQA